MLSLQGRCLGTRAGDAVATPSREALMLGSGCITPTATSHLEIHKGRCRYLAYGDGRRTPSWESGERAPVALLCFPWSAMPWAASPRERTSPEPPPVTCSLPGTALHTARRKHRPQWPCPEPPHVKHTARLDSGSHLYVNTPTNATRGWPSRSRGHMCHAKIDVFGGKASEMPSFLLLHF